MEEKNDELTNPSSLLSAWKNRVGNKSLSNKIRPKPSGTPNLPSSGQARLFVLQQNDLSNPFYQYAHIYKINGPLDIDVLTKSFSMLIEDNDVLRSNYVFENGKVKMVIQEKFDFKIHEISIPNESSIQQACLIFSRKPFDLKNDLLIRLAVVKISLDKHLLVLSMHHIIGDQWSLNIINDHWLTNYSLLNNDHVVTRNLKKLQYQDYSYWQSEKPLDELSLQYWKKSLDQLPEPLSFPFSRKRNKQPSNNGRILFSILDKKGTDNLYNVSRSLDTTLYVVILTVLKCILYRYTGQNDLVIGTPFLTRDKPELEKIIGFFNDTLVIRSQMNPTNSLKYFISQEKNIVEKAFEHKYIPYEEVIKAIKPDRIPGVNPVFQIMYIHNKALEKINKDLPFTYSDKMMDLGVSKFDFTLFSTEVDGKIELSLEYADDLFTEKSMTGLLQHLSHVLINLNTNLEKPIVQIDYLSSTEKNNILKKLKGPEVDFYPTFRSVTDIIWEIGQKYPDNIAVSDVSGSITYGELLKRAGSLAQCLFEHDVSNNHCIGIMTSNGLNTIVAILGTLSAGATYLPLDPKYPKDRLKYMVRDSGVNIILETGNLNTLEIEGIEILSISDVKGNKKFDQSILPNFNDPQAGAYVIYTSGSTGKPKGVLINHKNLSHSTLARYEFYDNSPEAFLLLSSFSFDSSVVGIYWTLVAGGKLVIPEHRIEQNPDKLGKLIVTEQITHTLLLPSLYNALMDACPKDLLKSLKVVIVAGETLHTEVVQMHYNLFPKCKLYNEYGPTEATVWCIAHKLSSQIGGLVPIGRPISNTEALILDDNLEMVGEGLPGELYIAGDGVAEGYLNRSDLTNEKFLKHPFDKKKNRIYKTGDLVRINEEGDIVFLGRIDQQIKIRGYRIELQEIQSAMMTISNIKMAYVSVIETDEKQGQGRKKLVGYYQMEKGIGSMQLKSELESKLPEYMVPDFFVKVDEFIKLPNGKIDHTKLPNPVMRKERPEGIVVKPISDNEIKLKAIWEELLGIKSIGVLDNFFGLGGDSILSIRLISKAKKKGITLEPHHIFQYQTIRDLGRQIEIANKSVIENKFDEHDLIEQHELSEIQKGYYFNLKKFGPKVDQLVLEFNLTGIIDYSEFESVFPKLLNIHPILKAKLFFEEDQMLKQKLTVNEIAAIELYENTKEEEYEKLIFSIKEKNNSKPLDLCKGPTNRWYLVKKNNINHTLIWVCHHLFLDGWSCAIIVRDLLRLYEGKLGQSTYSPRVTNFFNYLDWKDKLPVEAARRYWRDALFGFQRPQVFKSTLVQNKHNNFIEKEIFIQESISSSLSSKCIQNNVSLGIFFQACLALIMSKLFDSNDLIFGTTVSGRFSSYPEVEKVCGLLMNVVPSRIKVEEETFWNKFMQKILYEQGSQRNYEDSSLSNILDWINWPVGSSLFDVLFVFGNFMQDKEQIGKLELNEFKGEFKSGFPLTLRINPGQRIHITWRCKADTFQKNIVSWLCNSLEDLISFFVENEEVETTEALEVLKDINSDLFVNRKSDNVADYRNFLNQDNADDSDLQIMTNIFKSVLGKQDMRTKDNFFDLGGTSLQAIQLISMIEKATKNVVEPSVLFSFPSPVLMTQYIFGSKDIDYQIVIPVNKSNKKSYPLFCFHGGGGHVFFYQKLGKLLEDNFEVFSIQPPEVNDVFPDSITDLSSLYVDHILRIQDEGPYHLLGTCFSNAVVLEVARLLIKKNRQIGKTIIVDSGPLHLFGNNYKGEKRTFRRFLDLAMRGDVANIIKKVKKRINPIQNQLVVDNYVSGETQIQLKKLIEKLNELYATYNWQPIDTKINFIRSSEFDQRKDKRYHVSRWNSLAKQGIEVSVVPGNHISLFDEPSVYEMAKRIIMIIKD